MDSSFEDHQILHDSAYDAEDTRTLDMSSTSMSTGTDSRRPTLSSKTSSNALTSMEDFPPTDSKGHGLLPSMPCGSTTEYISLDCLEGATDETSQTQWSSTRCNTIEAPYDYISDLPSKNIRDKFIDAVNIWIGVDDETLVKVKEVTGMLHNASLILDDFQDGSSLRRGKPSTHEVFGPAQSINSAAYVIVKAIFKIQHFSDLESTKKAMVMIMALFQGQAMDLHWTFNSICPSAQEYAKMINDKTGGLFGLACHLMISHAQEPLDSDVVKSLDRLIMLWGQYFQIRDDYMNLVDTEYSELKGFCEDLDEGKYSLPLIHALGNDPKGLVLPSLLSVRRTRGNLAYQQKLVVLDQIGACGGFKHTEGVLMALHRQIGTEIESLEAQFKKENPGIRALADRLRI